MKSGQTNRSDPLDSYAALLEMLLRCTRAVRDRVAAPCQQAGLSDTQLMLLWKCARSDSTSSQRELAECIGLSPAQVSAIVEQLRTKGLISGRRSRGDRRRQVWETTDRGRKALSVICQALVHEMPAFANDEMRDFGALRTVLQGLPHLPTDIEPSSLSEREAA